MIILSERHLHRLMGDYVAYFNHSRPHQGIGQHIPAPLEDVTGEGPERLRRIIGHPVLGGLHHDYRRVA